MNGNSGNKNVITKNLHYCKILSHVTVNIWDCSKITTMRGGYNTKIAVLPRWLYYQGDCITEVPVLPWLYYQGDCIIEVPVLPWLITEVAAFPRWLYITEVAVFLRWLCF